MRYIFKFPDIGEGLDEGTIVEWHVEKGQTVQMGDPLCTMETDKVVTAIPSPKKGVIAAKFGKVGETVHVGSALVEIDIEGVEGAAAVEEENKVEPLEEGAGVVGTLEVAGNSAILVASKEGIHVDENAIVGRVKALATPIARAIAKDMGLDVNSIKGSGPGGRVTKEDVIRFAQEGSKSTMASALTGQKNNTALHANLIDIEPLSQMRKTIAKNMIQSKHNAAHMTVFEEAEVSELDRIRKKHKELLAAEGIKLTYLAFVVKATAMALKKFRALNSEMDIEKSVIKYKKYYNIGIATDTEKGLVVPVIRNADQLSIREIAIEIQKISDKARDGKLTMEDMKDGTFTITSYGSIGGLFAVPVINYPQAAILGIGRISKRPIVKDDQLAIGLVLPLSLSVDHRIVDGGDTARFVNSIIGYLTDPISLIMD